MNGKIEQIEAKRKHLQEGGGPKEIDKQHKAGKLTARERMQRLFDRGTFEEIDLWATPLPTGFDVDEKELPADAVVAGYGDVNGRPVYSYSHDFTVIGGSQSAVLNAKVTKIIQSAITARIPYVAMIDSGGIRIQDMFGWPDRRPIVGNLPIGGGGSIMYSPVIAGGVVPRVSLMLGPCYAGAAYSPVLADFLFMREKISYMSLAAPPVIKAVTFVDVTQEEVGGARLHAEVTGSCDVLVQTDEEALDKSRQLLAMLPSSYLEKAPVVATSDSPDRKDGALRDIAPGDGSKSYDVHDVISRIVDDGYFFEVKPLYARSMVVGLSRMAGQTVGIVANNPAVAGGVMTLDTSDKGAKFIRTCDCFNIPLIFLVDTVGYLPNADEEARGLARHAAKMPFAICEASVPKITVFLGSSTMTGGIAMCSPRMGGDRQFAWPGARFKFVDYEGVVDALSNNGASASLASFNSSPINAGGLQWIEDIIDPSATRPMLVKSLRLLANKKVESYWRKHGNIPL